MKVIINFSDVRIIVPCKSGDLSVRDVIQLAIERYKKATAKVSLLIILLNNITYCYIDSIFIL
jgi:hypothetical protein